MKKNLLIAGACTAVATVLAAAPSFAADPIKLSVGGTSTVVTGYASQEDSYLSATGTEVTAVDVKGDNTLSFTGSTKLDNGLTVSVQYDLEAGGTPDSRTDPTDTYSVSVGGSFGTIVAGANGTALSAIATGAPSVGKAFNGLAEGDLISGYWVVAPTSLTVGGFGGAGGLMDSAYIDVSKDAESISYISPSVYGFTFGASYVPDALVADDTQTQPRSGQTAVNALNLTGGSNEGYGVGLMYAGTYGGLGVKAQGGYLWADAGTTVGGVSVSGAHTEWQAGATLTYAGFGFGGAYRAADTDISRAAQSALGARSSLDAQVWELGGSYTVGPYSISLSYFDSTADSLATTDAEDEAQVWELAGNYTMGPGVDLVAGVGHVKFEDGLASTATAAQRNAAENEGWVVATGLSLAF